LKVDLMKRFKNSLKQAFTLAEVLITLGIIGIVAEMTIPTLMNNVQDSVFKAGWKKEYSTLNQVINQIYADEGVTYNTADYPDYQYMARYWCKIQKRLKVVESGMVCGDEDSSAIYTTYASWPKSGKNLWHSDDAWKAKDGQLMRSNTGYFPMTATLADGSMIKFCCGNEFSVDVNGFKKPNVVGKDIYFFLLNWDGSNKTTLWGYANGSIGPPYETLLTPANYASDCDSGKGWGCSYKYLYQ